MKQWWVVPGETGAITELRDVGVPTPRPGQVLVRMAGAGVKRCHTHVATDDFSYTAEHDGVTVHYFHATSLHLLGLEHERLTFYHDGLERRLTDVEGEVIRGVLA